MLLRHTLIFFFVLSSFSLFSQRNCGTMQYHQQMLDEDPSLFQKMQNQEIQIQQWILNNTSMENTSVITIPVVVHVVYYNNTENISDNQIFSQIDILNEDFRRLNADTTNTPTGFLPVAADCEIEFCLAQKDPNGNTTTGITRTQTSQTSFSTNDDVKYTASGGHDAWNTSEYMNIWVCDISGGILGYAQFPGGNPNEDGIVVDYQYFGNIGTASSPYDLGRTATHEVGHWLNLRHIWGDSNCGNDFCNDTPEHDGSNYGCPSYPHTSSCSGNGPYGDMFQNYMDYTNDACMNIFTLDQKARMIAAINTSRQGLLTSNGCNTDYGCTDSTALNYDSLAIFDDGSCCYVAGCTDISAFNFDSTACIDDGSCVPAILGCTDPSASNYDPNANTSIAFGGAVDNTIGTGGYFNGNQHLIFDATKPFKIKSAVVYAQNSNTITFELRDNNSAVIDDTTINVVSGQQRLYFDFDVPIGTDFELGISASNSGLYRNNAGPDYPYVIGSAMTITSSSANSSPTGYYYFYYDIEIEDACFGLMSGCTDSTALNFNPSAAVDDGSCCYVAGCTDFIAANYDPLACFDDSSCCYITTTNVDTSSCFNFTYNGNTYTSSGTYNFVYTNNCGYDSLVNIILDIQYPDTSFSTVTNCDSYFWNGILYNSSGTYVWNDITSSGCDTTAYLTLQINNSYSTTVSVDTCDEYEWYGDTYTNSGTYSETFTNILGCDSTIYLNLNLSTSPSLSVSQSGTSLIATPFGGNIPYNYIWSNGETLPIISPMINGTYWLVVVDANGCYSDTVFVNVDFVPSYNLNISEQIKIYPNPAENIINIVTENSIIELAEITNSLGQVVIRKESQNNILKVDISNLEYGTYLLNVLSQETYLNKIIIKK